MHVQATSEHAWLKKWVGEWTYEFEAPGETSTGRESVRAIGDVWIQCEGRVEMPDGTPATTVMTLGYDTAAGRFVGTFLGSMMTYMWIYNGRLEADGTRLTLDTEGPSFADDGRIVKYRDVVEWRSDDHRVLISTQQDADGNFQPFMTAHYRRVKSA